MKEDVILKNSFPCNQCGLCCQKVSLAPEIRYLDRGDGKCINFDESSNLCKIYDERPDICRIDVQYEKNYSQLFSWDQFIELNYSVCKILQAENKPKYEIFYNSKS